MDVFYLYIGKDWADFFIYIDMSYKKSTTNYIKHFISKNDFENLKNTGKRIEDLISGYYLQNLILDDVNYWLFSTWIVNGSGSTSAFFRSETYNNFLFNNNIYYCYDNCWYNFNKNNTRKSDKIETIKIDNKSYSKNYIRKNKLKILID